MEEQTVRMARYYFNYFSKYTRTMNVRAPFHDKCGHREFGGDYTHTDNTYITTATRGGPYGDGGNATAHNGRMLAHFGDSICTRR